MERKLLDRNIEMLLHTIESVSQLSIFESIAHWSKILDEDSSEAPSSDDSDSSGTLHATQTLEIRQLQKKKIIMSHENVSDYKTSIWQKQSSSTDQLIRANKCVKILISNSKEVRITITLRAAGKPAAHFVFVVLIMEEFLMAKLEFMVVAFFKA